MSTCLSSQLISHLLAWRNPQGSEEGWMLAQPQGANNGWKFSGKIVTAEIGLLILATTSAVETIAYAILTLSSVCLIPFSHQPYQFFGKLLESSSFSILWSLADIFVYNPFFINVMTKEPFARYFAEHVNPTSIPLFRMEDIIYLSTWTQQYPNPVIQNGMLGAVFGTGRQTEIMIKQGATFLTQDLLLNATPESIALFKEMDPSMFMFVLTKAIFLYTMGSKCKSEIPNFFKLETRKNIQELRGKKFSQEILQELERLLSELDKFEDGLKDPRAQEAFNQLRNAASKELQNSLFVTQCWKKACETLP